MKNSLFALAALLALPVSAAPRGTLCLTFDDQHFANWAKADAIFKKYDAHATFFVCGQLDRKAIRYMKFLQNAGHSVGLHGLHHKRAVDYLQQHGAGAYSANEIMTQLEVCRQNGIKIRAFAYPYSQNSAETDQELFKIFDFLRTSTAGIRKKDAPLAEVDGFFVKNPGKKQLFYGSPASGRFDMDDVKAALKRAADENAVIVFYAHNITPAICKSHHIATSQLSEILAFAKSLGMAIRGLNEL
jgi:peptidoglycan/xylan/chitin deacetylase (PgdA/CDA1 family)